jgi:geranylgeranyl diphosphate synthase type II
MDNDELRRWELTVWKKYGEANAVLIWDLLNSLSFEILSEIWNTKLIKLFWEAVWIKWMLWWQVLDLYYENNSNKLTIDNLIEVHNKKTWALIEISIIWALMLSEKNIDIKLYKEFWKKIWLAFQVKDDLLDVEWTPEETWKSVWDSEEKWFVYFMWLEKTHKYLNDLIFDCKKIIKELNSEKLNFLVDYIWNRKK